MGRIETDVGGGGRPRTETVTVNMWATTAPVTSVTFDLTEYNPAVMNTWVGSIAVENVPSPKLQAE
jgi:hypothetical protein